MHPLVQLLPPHGPTDVETAYADALGPAHTDRPHVTVNMVASLDGHTAVEGRTGTLSSPTDRSIFRFLRTLADVVLVGAATVRAERYGTIKTSDDVRARRTSRGQLPAAALAIVTRSLDLDWSAKLFTEPTQRPFVITPADASDAGLRVAEQVATVVRIGHGSVNLGEALRVLRQEHGVATVLCEGGPTLNAQLARGLLDQLCLTVSPSVVGGTSNGIFAPAVDAPISLELTSVLTAGGELYLRYGVGAEPVPLRS
jgi:riboflavin biosynthesis pyrimidine reductase